MTPITVVNLRLFLFNAKNVWYNHLQNSYGQANPVNILSTNTTTTTKTHIHASSSL